MHYQEYQRIGKIRNTYFWYRAMDEMTVSLVEKYVETKKRGGLQILDAGSEIGDFTEKLRLFGETIGIDINKLALKFAKKEKNVMFFQQDVCRMKFVNDRFDLVTCLDVLYHKGIRDDMKALSEIRRVLKPHGYLLIRVPALESLRGSHDTVVATRKRYSIRELRERVERAGFKIIILSYANMTLAVPLLVKRIFERVVKKKDISDLKKLPSLSDSLFYLLMRAENLFVIRGVRLPFGSSLVCLARKIK